MSILTDDMKRVVTQQRLGFVATANADGTPNLSPKGTVAVWDDDHLVFADIRSPQTVANLQRNAAVEINVVDNVMRKGYRFRGTATVLTEGPQYDDILRFYQERGARNPIRALVLITVDRAQPLTSPAYDLGLSEDEVRERWRTYWASLDAGREATATGE